LILLIFSLSTQPLALYAQTANNSDVLPNIRENITNQNGQGNTNNPIGNQDDGDDIFIPLPGIGNGNGNGNWIGNGWRPGFNNGFNNGDYFYEEYKKSLKEKENK
jgi:hypothetical protein